MLVVRVDGVPAACPAVASETDRCDSHPFPRQQRFKDGNESTSFADSDRKVEFGYSCASIPLSEDLTHVNSDHRGSYELFTFHPEAGRISRRQHLRRVAE